MLRGDFPTGGILEARRDGILIAGAATARSAWPFFFFFMVGLVLLGVCSEARAQDANATGAASEPWSAKNRLQGLGLEFTASPKQVHMGRLQSGGTGIALVKIELPIRIRDYPHSWPIHRVEVIPEAVIGGNWNPPGEIVGTEVRGRLYFHRIGRALPYGDFGFGVNRVGNALPQPDITGKLQFSLQANIGVKYYPKRFSNFAWTLSATWLHYSNNNLQRPNEGINYFSASAGFVWHLFGKQR